MTEATQAPEKGEYALAALENIKVVQQILNILQQDILTEHAPDNDGSGYLRTALDSVKDAVRTVAATPTEEEAQLTAIGDMASAAATLGTFMALYPVLGLQVMGMLVHDNAAMPYVDKGVSLMESLIKTVTMMDSEKAAEAELAAILEGSDEG